MKRLISSLAMLLRPAVPAAAQGFDKGKKAYERGNYEVALRELRPLAEQGDPLAQTLLGYMCSSGDGVAEDQAEAVRWYLLAAERGYSSAQYNLGLMFADGAGVPQDDLQALMWFSLAAAQGDAVAKKEHEVVAALMAPDQVEEAEQMASAWTETHGK
jgi:TPR repeat protein